ncbi:NAD(P)H-dependent oxidoreductase [Paenibacillus terreus]|uniref:NAD(P)H-dependent oxidoreductase n=1 Tax=Paenibacillus terreus TaxID=1387834 RepID=A0ABV5BCB9_9BACL
MKNHSNLHSDLKTLVIVAHPDLKTSRINQRLTAELEQRGKVTVHKLYEIYPDEKIDVGREQALLLSHDRIVFQFPLQWYSSPSLLKKWIDEILYKIIFADGHAKADSHAKGRDKLKGKELLVAISTGGTRSMFQAGGRHNFTISELLRPFQQTANYVGMIYRQPFVVSGILEVSDEQLESYAREYADYLES